MKAILNNILKKLQTISEISYVDEDWGQLDYYSPNFPVLWPCALIDVTGAQYSNIGKDRTAIPVQRQEGTATLTIKVANLKLTPTSGMVPSGMREAAWGVEDIIQKVHEKLQGFIPEENSGALIRTSRGRTKRDDGVQEYAITYTFGVHNC